MKQIITLSFFLLSISFSFAQESKVLFIGNSYTYVNDLPAMFDALSTSLGKTVTVGSKTNGGFTFQNHYNDQQTFTAMHQQEWNLVVLQAQSQEPSFPYDQVNTNTLPYSNLLADSAYAISPCTNVMYYMTWGRENGDPQWDSINTFAKMNERLYNAYMRFADSAEAMVSPVAVAWKYVRDNYPAIQLYNGDGSHPSLEGTYLIACTFYASVFQETPVGASYYGGINPATAAILQNAAAVSVLNDLDLYHLHSIETRTVAGLEWNLDANGLLTATSTSVHDEELDWTIDGTHYTTEDMSHQLPAPGTYTLRLIALSECNRDTAVAVVNYNNAGINGNEISTIRLYPNPSSGEIHVTGVQDQQILVFDINGRFLTAANLVKGTIDLVELKTGMYFLGIDNEFLRIQIQK